MWQETDCLSCANCCKTMSPTYTPADLKRISSHFDMTVDEFKAKWLYKDRNNDWLNKKQPCQFLNLTDNKCSIYPIRPKDCAGFPHHTKKKMVDYVHVYKQNIEYCPATYRWIEKMRERVEFWVITGPEVQRAKGPKRTCRKSISSLDIFYFWIEGRPSRIVDYNTVESPSVLLLSFISGPLALWPFLECPSSAST